MSESNTEFKDDREDSLDHSLDQETKNQEVESQEMDDQEELENQTEDINKSLEKKVDFLDDQLKRTLADFSNYKKRILKEQEGFVFQEQSKIILEFLSFKEILEKAIDHEENESSKKNILEIKNNFDNVLKRLDIEKLDLKEKEYDYNFSECIQTIKVTEKEKHNKILDVLENGYTYKQKLIKPGKVIVGLFTEE